MRLSKLKDGIQKFLRRLLYDRHLASFILQDQKLMKKLKQ